MSTKKKVNVYSIWVIGVLSNLTDLIITFSYSCAFASAKSKLAAFRKNIDYLEIWQLFCSIPRRALINYIHETQRIKKISLSWNKLMNVFFNYVSEFTKISVAEKKLQSKPRCLYARVNTFPILLLHFCERFDSSTKCNKGLCKKEVTES